MMTFREYSQYRSAVADLPKLPKLPKLQKLTKFRSPYKGAKPRDNDSGGPTTRKITTAQARTHLRRIVARLSVLVRSLPVE
jgi:hypothetical protein